ncbi:hypothetical protein EYF80_009009 [Liparis tanakae]|uniref:Uncharacterized protein n=1 Tax=Liparis tanakae TaxID=230148 RepID=A0A4Z2ISB0_9TELE|nr:hypothetical protein EYF80_009009 [Liparis tanakae]
MTLRNHCQKAGRSTGRLPKSNIRNFFAHRPSMAVAEAQIGILKVIVAAPFFSSCYFKVGNVTCRFNAKDSLEQISNHFSRTFCYPFGYQSRNYRMLYFHWLLD